MTDYQSLCVSMGRPSAWGQKLRHNRMRGLVFGAALIGALQLLSVGTVVAQDRDLRPLLDRLDRMERDMNQLQRQVYRGGSTSGAPVPVAPADGGTAVNLELRVDQIETQMRTLTGSLEEGNYSIDQLKPRLDKPAGGGHPARI